MADQTIGVPPDDTGKKVATYEKTEGGQTVQVQKVAIAGRQADDDVQPLSSAPAGTEFALPVRNIPSGTQATSAAALEGGIGASADLAVTGDSAGSLNAKLRGVNDQIARLREDVALTNQLLFLLLAESESRIETLGRRDGWRS